MSDRASHTHSNQLWLSVVMLAAGLAGGFLLGKLTGGGASEAVKAGSTGGESSAMGEKPPYPPVRMAGDDRKKRESERAEGGQERLSLDLATVDALLPDTTLTSRTLKRLGLDDNQTKVVNDEIAFSQRKFQEIEKAHSKLQTDANGDQCVVIEPHAAEIQKLVEQITASLKSSVPAEQASILARMIGRHYGGDEWSGALRREVYFSQPDDPAQAAEGLIIEKAFDGDRLVDTDYFSIKHGESRWGHLLDFRGKN